MAISFAPNQASEIVVQAWQWTHLLPVGARSPSTAQTTYVVGLRAAATVRATLRDRSGPVVDDLKQLGAVTPLPWWQHQKHLQFLDKLIGEEGTIDGRTIKVPEEARAIGLDLPGWAVAAISGEAEQNLFRLDEVASLLFHGGGNTLTDTETPAASLRVLNGVIGSITERPHSPINPDDLVEALKFHLHPLTKPSFEGIDLPMGLLLKPFTEAKDRALRHFTTHYRKILALQCGGNLSQMAQVTDIDRKNMTREFKLRDFSPTEADDPACHFFFPLQLTGPRYNDVKAAFVEHFSRLYFRLLLVRTGNNISEASRQAGIDRSNLRRILVPLGM